MNPDLVNAMEFDLDDWCSQVPQLIRVSRGFWAGQAVSGVSFPQDGLAALWEIENNSFWFTHRNRFIEMVMRRYPPQGPLFDIGGGNGLVARHLTNAGFEAVVVEPDTQGAAHAQRLGLPVIAAAFQDLDVPSAAMPAACLFDVLEHIADEKDALDRLADAIRPEGRLYISVPAYDFLWADEDVHSGHYRRYTLRRLCRSVSASGFRVDYASYIFAALVPAILLKRTIPYRLGIKPVHDVSKVESDHSLPKGPLGWSVARAMDLELEQVRRKGRLPFGSSCFIAATRCSP